MVKRHVLKYPHVYTPLQRPHKRIWEQPASLASNNSLFISWFMAEYLTEFGSWPLDTKMREDLQENSGMMNSHAQRELTRHKVRELGILEDRSNVVHGQSNRRKHCSSFRHLSSCGWPVRHLERFPSPLVQSVSLRKQFYFRLVAGAYMVPWSI